MKPSKELKNLKICSDCGTTFKKNNKLSNKQFKLQVYCSRDCFFNTIRHDEIKARESFYNKTKDGEGGCIEWTGGKCGKGYGMSSLNGRGIRAHRAAWYYKTGEVIPDGILACHKCDNPSCVNVDHLFLGTAKDNSDDKIKKGRAVYLKGDESPLSKLTEKQVIEIRKSKVPATVICSDYNVSQSTIRAARNGQNWRHLN